MVNGHLTQWGILNSIATDAANAPVTWAEVNSQDGGIPDRINAHFSVTKGSHLVGSHRILLDLKKDALRHVYSSKT